MKELWTANPFCLMNRPFAEMGYNSSGLNIAPKRLLLATRRPSMHHPLASGAPSFDPLRTTRRRTTNHATHGTTFGDPLQAIRHRTAQHPPSRCVPSSDPCAASVGSLHAICPPVHRAMPGDPRKPSAVVLRGTWRSPAQHPPSRRKPSAIARHSIRRPPHVIRWHPADICRHEPMPLTARRTDRRREQEP